MRPESSNALRACSSLQRGGFSMRECQVCGRRCHQPPPRSRTSGPGGQYGEKSNEGSFRDTILLCFKCMPPSKVSDVAPCPTPALRRTIRIRRRPKRHPAGQSGWTAELGIRKASQNVPSRGRSNYKTHGSGKSYRSLSALKECRGYDLSSRAAATSYGRTHRPSLARRHAGRSRPLP